MQNIQDRIKRKQYERGCRSKTRYRTRRKAIRKKSRAHYPSGLGVYRCKFCGYWHIGHDRYKE